MWLAMDGGTSLGFSEQILGRVSKFLIQRASLKASEQH